jgi:hypothetical protein
MHTSITNCLAVSKISANTAFCCDMTGNSHLCGVECDTAILQRLDSFLDIHCNFRIKFMAVQHPLLVEKKADASPWYLELSRVSVTLLVACINVEKEVKSKRY